MVNEVFSLGIMAFSVVTDMKCCRIPNWLTYVSMALGVMVNAIGEGPPGIRESISGILIIFAALYPVYLIRGLGAGDVKLFMAIASFLGPQQSIRILIISMPIALIIGIVKRIIVRVRAVRAGRNISLIRKTNIRYAPAVMMAAIVVFICNIK